MFSLRILEDFKVNLFIIPFKKQLYFQIIANVPSSIKQIMGT